MFLSDKGKINKILFGLAISAITTSIILAFFISLMTQNNKELERRADIQGIFIEQQNIPFQEISYTRKISNNFYEIVLDNKDIYTIRETRDGKYVISKIEEVVEKENE